MVFYRWGCLWVALFLWCALARALPQPAAGAQEGPAFDILEFQVEGNTVLPIAAVENAVIPFLGPGRSMNSVESARAALEKAYQDTGYLTVFVDVPEQRVEAGVVVLKVIEGRVERLKVSGSRYFSQGYIRERVTELAEGKVPNFNEVQRELSLVNRSEERRVQPVMRAGLVPGTVETELKVSDRLPLFASVEVNNHNAANTTPLRLSVSGRYENLFQRDHSVSLSLNTAPAAPKESRVWSLNYAIPDSTEGTWVGSALNSNSNVAAIGNVNVLGKGTTLGLRYVRVIGSIAQQSHNVTIGLDYKHVDQQTQAGTTVISTPLRYMPLQLAYNGTFLNDGSETQIAILSTLNSRAVFQREVANCPGGPADQFACLRQGGDGGFATLRGELRKSWPLGGFGSANLRLTGQLATGPVPSAEQFAIGGAQTVRGYYEAESAGDEGLLASIEWHSPDFSSWASALLQRDESRHFTQSYAFLFVDTARDTTIDPAAGQAPHVTLGSVGFGLTLRLAKSLASDLDLAWPARSTSATVRHRPRAGFRLVADF